MMVKVDEGVTDVLERHRGLVGRICITLVVLGNNICQGIRGFMVIMRANLV